MTRTDRVLQAALGILFAAAGAFKIAGPFSFAVSIAQLRMLPMALVGPVAILLPWIELVAAVALFVPTYRAAALKLVLGLLVMFTAILGIALLRGTAASCGCFGSADAFINRPDVSLVRNALMIAAAVVLLRRMPTSSPAAPASPA